MKFLYIPFTAQCVDSFGQLIIYALATELAWLLLGMKQYIEILLYCNIHYCNTIQYGQ